MGETTWKRTGTTVYALNEAGMNRWWAKVRAAGTGSADAAECERVAALMADAPDLRDVLAAIVAGIEAGDTATVWGLVDDARNALANAGAL